MKLAHYILNDDGTTKKVGLMEWAHWFQNFDKRSIAQYERGGYRVSTIFLGIDHSFGRRGPPLLFETKCFDDQREVREVNGLLYRTMGEDYDGARYATKDDALIGHARYVKELNKMLDEAAAKVEAIAEVEK